MNFFSIPTISMISKKIKQVRTITDVKRTKIIEVNEIFLNSGQSCSENDFPRKVFIPVGILKLDRIAKIIDMESSVDIIPISAVSTKFEARIQKK